MRSGHGVRGGPFHTSLPCSCPGQPGLRPARPGMIASPSRYPHGFPPTVNMRHNRCQHGGWQWPPDNRRSSSGLQGLLQDPRRGQTGQRRRYQEGLPAAGAQVPPRCQQGAGCRRAHVRDQRGQHGAVRSGTARGLRPAGRCQPVPAGRVPSAAGLAGCPRLWQLRRCRRFRPGGSARLRPFGRQQPGFRWLRRGRALQRQRRLQRLFRGAVWPRPGVPAGRRPAA